MADDEAPKRPGASRPAPGYLGPKSPRGTEDPASVGDDGPPVLPYPLGQSWFERLITLRMLSYRHGGCDPISARYDTVRRSADEAFDLAADAVRHAIAEAARGAWEHALEVGEPPTWQCRDCYWLGAFGEAAFSLASNDLTPYCPMCRGALEALPTATPDPPSA